MSKVLGIVLVFIMILSMTACESTTSEETTQETIVEVEYWYVAGEEYFVYVDTDTKVMYFRVDGGYDGGMLMLVNADGTPKLYEGEFEE